MSPSLRHPAVDAALATAATLLGTEVVFIGRLDETTFTFARVHGSWPGLAEGLTSNRAESFCHRMLAGAPGWTPDAGSDAAYADAPIRERLGIRTYVGVPVGGADGTPYGSLCGIDRSSLPVDEEKLDVLRELAGIVAAHLVAGDEGVSIRRTPEGWLVTGAGEELQDLTAAMVLADLLRDDAAPGARPSRAPAPVDEVARLRLAVTQLEHALAARVTVEQAIGVLAERLALAPRDAFERLRKVARRSGTRVHDLSRDVVRSVTEDVVLPDELRS